ncbi:MAG: hypothetical protein ACRDVC_07590 [Acidimicrobiales bacterium]
MARRVEIGGVALAVVALSLAAATAAYAQDTLSLSGLTSNIVATNFNYEFTAQECYGPGNPTVC